MSELKPFNESQNMVINSSKQPHQLQQNIVNDVSKIVDELQRLIIDSSKQPYG